ncbi:MAG: asparagine synthase (glutamine-hydrolyzing), partial [Candidatus Eisenbacteria bacterium]
LLASMTDLLTHRGPDDSGLYISGPIGLGQRRLSIVDLSPAGRNPMPNEDDTIWLTFNGELYNVLDRRDELAAKGHRFRSHTDTEVLVHLYEEYGFDVVHELRGMFAFAIWDAPRRTLLVVRDRLGIKPLYWRSHNGTFAFASEMKALLADPACPRTVDPRALEDYLALQYVPSPGSMIEGIHKLSPGHMLIVTPQGVEERRYWTPPVGETTELSFDDAAAELRRLLEESVRLRFMSDVPFGAFLSGGIDSSIVCALMARLMDPPVKTFTIGFKGAPEDESVYARQVAQHLGAEHHEFVVEPDALAILPSLVWHLDEPLADTSTLPTWAVSEMARQHVKVVLSGDGGDETFAGYETYRLAQAYARVDRLPAGLRRMAASAGGRAPGKWASRFERLGLDAIERHVRVMAIADRATYAPLLAGDFRAAANGHDPLAALRAHAGGFAPSDLRALLHLDLTTYMTDDVLAKVDRMSMAHALEVRVPLLDHKLVEFASTLPFDFKLRGGVSKALLKHAVRDLLPASILGRGKQGFAVPLKHWFGDRFQTVLGDVLSPASIRNRGMFDERAVAGLIARATAPAPDARAGRLMWALIVFEMWARSFLDRVPEIPAKAPPLVARELALEDARA